LRSTAIASCGVVSRLIIEDTICPPGMLSTVKAALDLLAEPLGFRTKRPIR
jgi:hypothetical protein